MGDQQLVVQTLSSPAVDFHSHTSRVDLGDVPPHSLVWESLPPFVAQSSCRRAVAAMQRQHVVSEVK